MVVAAEGVQPHVHLLGLLLLGRVRLVRVGVRVRARVRVRVRVRVWVRVRVRVRVKVRGRVTRLGRVEDVLDAVRVGAAQEGGGGSAG